jgi:hypothetical protein
MKHFILLCFVVVSVGACSDDIQSPSNEENDILLLEDAHFPSYSPDGMEIICNRTTPNLLSCAWRIPRNTPLTGLPSDTLFVEPTLKYGPMFPKWMPDGERVVYYGIDQTEEHRYFMIRDVVHDHDNPGIPTQLIEIDGLWDDAGFTLAPDGSQAFYTVWTLESGNVIRAINLNNESTRVVCTGDQAAVSPDGK